MRFLKTFGLGLLYIILLPFILLGLALFAVFGLVFGIIEFLICAVRFFKGEKIFPPFKEDLLAQEILGKAAGLNKEEPVTQTTNSTVYVQQNYYQNNPQVNPAPQNPNQISQDPFINPAIPNDYQQQSIPEQPVQEIESTPSYGPALTMENDVEKGENND